MTLVLGYLPHSHQRLETARRRLQHFRKAALGLAAEIAESAPLAVQSTRETVRRGFADGAEVATERELTEQDWTRKTEDFKEGIKSYAEKRAGNFKGR